MKTDLGYKYQVGLEVITPVSVGNGETMSLYTDFSVFEDGENKYARILNKKLFETELQANIPAMTDFVLQVREQAMKNEEGDKGSFLFNFIKESLGIAQPESLYYEKQIPVIGNANTVNLTCCLKEKGKPYISGSTLKGAVKSALLFDWLNDARNEDKLENIVKALDKVFYIPKSVAPKDKKEYRSTQIKKTNDLIDTIIHEFLEKINKSRMSFSLMRLTDCYLQPDTKTHFVHCTRYSVVDKKENNKIFIEAIPKSASGEFEMFFENNKVVQNKKTDIKYLFGGSIEPLFTKINTYSRINLSFEQNYLAKNLSEYKTELSNIEKAFPKKNNNSCLLPIGVGKEIFYQSIGLLIWNKIQENEDKYKYAFKNYMKLYKLGKKDESMVPLTRNLIVNSQKPLGWIKLTEIK
jgi:CRISPR-associated protein Csm5